jgi:hypothetical protein
MFTKETSVDQLPAELQGLWQRCCDLLAKVRYKERYKLYIGFEEPRIYIQIGNFRPDAVTGDWDWGRSGRFYLDPDLSDRDIVGRAFRLFLDYEQHECKEFFRFDGLALFNPHITLEALCEAAKHTDPIKWE